MTTLSCDLLILGSGIAGRETASVLETPVGELRVLP